MLSPVPSLMVWRGTGYCQPRLGSFMNATKAVGPKFGSGGIAPALTKHLTASAFGLCDARLIVMVSLRDVFLARAIFQLVGQRPGSLRIGKLDPDLGHCILVILHRASSAKAARTKAHVAGIF